MKFWVRFWAYTFLVLAVAASCTTMGDSAHASTPLKTVYLTLDDGPGPHTLEVLDILKQYDAHATFFQEGQHIQQWPELFQAIVAAGQGVGNHTWHHLHSTTLTEQVFRDEINQTQSIMGAARNTCFRPPFFDTNEQVSQWVKELGMRQVMSRMDETNPRRIESGPASEPDPLVVYNTVISSVFDGGMITMHAEGTDTLGDLAALPMILSRLKSMGYEVKALPYCQRPLYRIMALGDSITRGIGQDGTVYSGYRTKLDQYLRYGAVPSGFNYRWVGSMESEPRIGFDHEGHGGWTIDQIYDNITAWQKTYSPDVILLHIGTNNITDGELAATVSAKLAKLLARIRQNQSYVRVFVARIIDVGTGVSKSQQDRNAAYASATYATTVAAGTRFYTVDMRGIGGEALYDYHHPNRFGYTKMAYLWYEVMRGILPLSYQWRAVGSPYNWTHDIICHYNYTVHQKVCADQPVNDGKG